MRYLYLFVVGAFLASCSSEQEKSNNLTLPEGQLPTMNSSSTAAPAGVTLNPAHGQPGHDCAIPVGAPLNNAPVAAQAPVSAGGVILNPAHGQPGHDCALPVGAPLNSAAAAPAPAPAPVPAAQTQSTTTEVLQEANGG